MYKDSSISIFTPHSSLMVKKKKKKITNNLNFGLYQNRIKFITWYVKKVGSKRV